jgi:hypothetical protein
MAKPEKIAEVHGRVSDLLATVKPDPSGKAVPEVAGASVSTSEAPAAPASTEKREKRTMAKAKANPRQNPEVNPRQNPEEDEDSPVLSRRATAELQEAYDSGVVSGSTLDEIDPGHQVGEPDDDDEDDED